MSERTERILQPMVEHQAYMDDRVQAGIEANRKGFARLEFVNAQGDAVTDVHVSLEQMSHDFRFGANCFMLDELETAEKNSEYQSRFRELFNLATLPFYWSDLEPEAGKPRFGKDSPACTADRCRISALSSVKHMASSPSCIVSITINGRRHGFRMMPLRSKSFSTAALLISRPAMPDGFPVWR